MRVLRSPSPRPPASKSDAFAQNSALVPTVSFGAKTIVETGTREVLWQMLVPDASSRRAGVTEVMLAAEIAASGDSVALRLPNRSIGDARVLSYLELYVDELDLDPARLLFELDGSGMQSMCPEKRRFVEELHDFGCKIALDDAGTEAGTFTYLPCDYLIIDKADVQARPMDANLIDAIVGLAASFGFATIAQGVQTDEALAELNARGVDLAMGDQISPCVPVKRMDLHRGGRSWVA